MNTISKWLAALVLLSAQLVANADLIPPYPISIFFRRLLGISLTVKHNGDPVLGFQMMGEYFDTLPKIIAHLGELIC